MGDGEPKERERGFPPISRLTNTQNARNRWVGKDRRESGKARILSPNSQSLYIIAA